MTTICDKINTVGTILQENLNDRGVSCTFGGGSGEKNILQLVELVNDTNFKGSSDVNLKIGANRPYLLTGETTDVIVKLENGLCEPLKNKNVTIEQSPFRDNGTTASHNDNWVKYNPNNITITRGEEYTSVTGSNYRYGVPISNNCKIKVETRKPTASTGTLLSIWGYGLTPLSASQLLLFSVTEMGMTQGTFANIEMTVTPTTVTVKNLDNNTTITKEYSTSYNLIFNFWGTTFDYKNFKVYETIDGVTDGKGEFALYDVSVTDDTTFTATYSSVSDSIVLEYCTMVDYGVTNNSKLDYWYWNTNYGTGSVSDDGTTFTATNTSNYITSYATLTTPATSSTYIYDFPLTVEFDIVSYNDPSGVTDYTRARVYNNANSKNAFWNLKDYGIGHYKIVCKEGSQKLYYNGVEQSRSFTFTPNSAWSVAFQTKGHIKFKNFRIKEL